MKNLFNCLLRELLGSDYKEGNNTRGRKRGRERRSKESLLPLSQIFLHAQTHLKYNDTVARGSSIVLCNGRCVENHCHVMQQSK